MKAISLWQPWAHLVVHGTFDQSGRPVRKDVENRTWRTKFRRRVLIHASKAFSKKEFMEANRFLTANFLMPVMPRECFFGGVIGSVAIAGCVNDSLSLWAMERHPMNGRFAWHWLLEDPRPMKPFRVRGYQGFFEVGIHEDDVGQLSLFGLE